MHTLFHFQTIAGDDHFTWNGFPRPHLCNLLIWFSSDNTSAGKSSLNLANLLPQIGLGACISLLGLPLQSTINLVYWTTEIFSHSSGSQKFKIKAALIPSEGSEEESVPCLSPSFWLFAGNLWCFLAYGHIIPISTFIFMWCSPCVCVFLSNFPPFIRAPVILN